MEGHLTAFSVSWRVFPVLPYSSSPGSPKPERTSVGHPWDPGSAGFPLFPKHSAQCQPHNARHQHPLGWLIQDDLKVKENTATHPHHLPRVVRAILGVNVEIFTLQGNKRDVHRQNSRAIISHLKTIQINSPHAFKSVSPTTWARLLSPGGKHLRLFIHFVSYLESTCTWVQ